ncbi:MAG: hypothetical protein GVY19_05450 [Bacteroidetes bacterium]|jgi:hypothetical protein|nr:hypothetical protein [Bacteroidota bacterium]
MKKLSSTTLVLLLLVSTIVLFTACEELGEQFGEEFGLSLDTDYYTFDLDVLPTPAGEKIFTEDVFPSDIDSVMDAAGATRNQLQSAYVKEAYVQFKASDTVHNFNAFKSIVALVDYDGLTDTLAWIDNIPENARKLRFEVTDQNVVEYLDQNEYSYLVKGVLKNAISDTLYIEGKIKYELNVGI